MINKLAENNSEIFLSNGKYREKLHISRDRLRISGESTEGTVITWDDYAKKDMDGDNYGTFRSYTAYFGCESFLCENLTIENGAGDGSVVGQAVAAYIDCRRAYFRNVKFIARQDTIFITPLPEKPVIPNSFKGPNEKSPRLLSKVYFENCYIEGNIDFIFGGGQAVFENCRIHSVSCKNGADGYICAPSTDKDVPFGFVFINCEVTGEKKNSTYLGRPWRAHGKTAFIDCSFDESVIPVGWDPWGKEENKKTAVFSETADTFSSERADWSHCLSAEERLKHLGFAEELKKECRSGYEF